MNMYLEAAFDQARLEGLPKQHTPKYRNLILVKRKFVFRLRLGKEDPAILPPLKVQTYPGAKLRKGYKISFNKLTKEQLDALHKELQDNKNMGVVGDAPLNSVLHSLLTLYKPSGGWRWVAYHMYHGE